MCKAMPFDSLWEPLVLGVNVSISYLLYRSYQSKDKDANTVSNMRSYSVDSSLLSAIEEAPNKCLAYACIEGMTESSGTPLKSHFTDAVGVVQQQVFVEHKSKRTQGFWNDVKHVIKNVTNVRPFYIVDSESKIENQLKVEVADPLSSEYLLEYLPVTYDKFDPSKDGVFSKGLDRLFGEVTKGYQETEKMLGVGVPILGLGMITLDGKRLFLQPPPTDDQKYIVTTLSKQEVIRLLQSDSRTRKIFFWIFTVFGFGFFGYILYRFIKRQLADAENRRRIDELRQPSRNGESDREGNKCVVCMNNPREVVILNCGHVCICSECAVVLTEPKTCPVCRSSISRFLPIYVS